MRGASDAELGGEVRLPDFQILVVGAHHRGAAQSRGAGSSGAVFYAGGAVIWHTFPKRDFLTGRKPRAMCDGKKIPACRGTFPPEPCRKARSCCLVVTGEPEARYGVLVAARKSTSVLKRPRRAGTSFVARGGSINPALPENRVQSWLWALGFAGETAGRPRRSVSRWPDQPALSLHQGQL